MSINITSMKEIKTNNEKIFASEISVLLTYPSLNGTKTIT